MFLVLAQRFAAEANIQNYIVTIAFRPASTALTKRGRTWSGHKKFQTFSFSVGVTMSLALPIYVQK